MGQNTNAPVASIHGVELEPIISKPRIDNTGLTLVATKSAFPAESLNRISKNLLKVGKRRVYKMIVMAGRVVVRMVALKS